MKGCAVLVEYGGKIIYRYENFKKNQQIIEEFYKNQVNFQQNNREIKGQTGCPGSVKGFVRIITNLKKEEEKFKPGEILVTGMTRPEFVPLMKKTKAVITDEGGITCHAAIVSRELKIPCIIGTKIATKILKDGDFVEVDANKGVVRKLK